MSRTPLSPRAKRLLIRSSAIAFIVVVGWVAVLLMLQTAGKEGHSFRKTTAQILRSLSEGKAGQIYDRASSFLKADIARSRFITIAEEIHQVLGPFQHIVASVPEEAIEGPQGTTARATSRIQFEKASTTGQFSYHLVNKSWRLLGMHIEIPGNRINAYDTRNQAQPPSKVLGLVTTILEQIRDGHTDRVYYNASAPFQAAVNWGRFEDIITLQKRQLGTLRKITDLSATYRDRTQMRIEVRASLEYSKITTSGTIELVLIGDTWKLLAYKILVGGDVVKL